MTRTPYHPEDKARLLALARLCPAENVHVIDLPYRLCSWALDNPQNVALWEQGGELMAWAVLQTPFWVLDFALHPAAPSDMLAEILAWADERAPRLPAAYARPSWFVAVLAGQTEWRRTLEAAGFADQSAGDGSWSQVIFRRDGREPVPQVTLRPGYAIRPLRGAAEVPAYVALHREVFGSTNMTEDWRRATLDAPGHRPEFDLVATDAAGELVGFAVGWWWETGGRRLAQVEPFGVRAGARRHGVAWGLMFELLRRLAEAGVEEVEVMTDRFRDAAFVFYQGCDFRIAKDVVVYRRDYEVNSDR